jgi:hypothetical protein
MPGKMRNLSATWVSSITTKQPQPAAISSRTNLHQPEHISFIDYNRSTTRARDVMLYSVESLLRFLEQNGGLRSAQTAFAFERREGPI